MAGIEGPHAAAAAPRVSSVDPEPERPMEGVGRAPAADRPPDPVAELRFLRRLLGLVTTAQTWEELLGTVVDGTRDALGASVSSLYLLDRDGTRLTLWRTAAASALAARHLARADASRMVMVGAGALAPFLIRAHRAARPITDVALWNHRPERAREVAQRLAAEGLPVRAAEDLEEAVRQADLVSCATLSTQPVVRGAWLAPGTHVDCVGAFRPDMRETDDDSVRRASLFCDTRGALAEGGDLAAPIAAGIIRPQDVRADLAALVRGTHPGRTDASEITLFKSAGAALEDLAAATHVWRRLAPPTP